MPGPRRVAVIGAGSHWGAEIARRLERDPTIEYVAGVDAEKPTTDLGRVDFIEADIRSPLLSRILPATEADTVVHCGILWYPAPGKPAKALHDINVIGTLQLLAACGRMPTLERVIVRGSAAIYGCEGAVPSFFTEDLARKVPLRTRFQRDISELEEYFANFARRHSEITCCMLRYQPEIGPGLDAPLARYLSLPVVPTQLGFDPRLQLMHADDATAALEAAVHDPVRGAVNVAPEGSISLSRALRLARRPSLPIPHPLFEPALARLGNRLGVGVLWGDGVRFLRYGRGVDNRKLRQEIGFEPVHDAASAVRDFASKATGRSIGPSIHPGAIADRLAALVPGGER